MKIKDYKCKCGHNDFFFANKGNQKGIYCSYCGRWFKWADKNEQNLAMKQELQSSSEEQTRWIPCSEKLPDLNDYDGPEVWQKKVLITGYLSFTDKKDLFVTEAFASDVVNNCVWDTVVVAWMPLPEPYNAESEDKE